VANSAAFNGFNQTVEIIKKTTAAQIAKRQVEEIALSSACDFDEFYQAQQAKSQPDEETGEILVISVDGKGVGMRREDMRPSTQKRAIAGQRKLKKRLTAGEKRNSKRMATVAAVYTINPFIRTAAQIVNPKPDEGVKRPRPQGKRVWASLVKEPETVIAEAFEEALSRDPHQQKHWVALVDGNQTQLRLLQELSQKHNIRLTIVLDLIHVIEYLWKAAFAFHPPSTQQAEDWVSERLLRILEGKSSSVASGMRGCATRLKLTPEQRASVDKCANYLLNHRDYLRYQNYLTEGFPIATGVIEGACRYLLKDRMDITGARWSLQGAEAVLRLRSLQVSGDWPDYWQFHLQQEHQRHHRALYQDGIPLLTTVTQACCSTWTRPTAMVV
jgi:hypothetical protein